MLGTVYSWVYHIKNGIRFGGTIQCRDAGAEKGTVGCLLACLLLGSGNIAVVRSHLAPLISSRVFWSPQYEWRGFCNSSRQPKHAQPSWSHELSSSHGSYRIIPILSVCIIFIWYYYVICIYIYIVKETMYVIMYIYIYNIHMVFIWVTSHNWCPDLTQNRSQA